MGNGQKQAQVKNTGAASDLLQLLEHLGGDAGGDHRLDEEHELVADCAAELRHVLDRREVGHRGVKHVRSDDVDADEGLKM